MKYNKTKEQSLDTTPDVVSWDRHAITSVVFLPKMHNLNLVMKKKKKHHQTNPKWGISYKITAPGTRTEKLSQMGGDQGDNDKQMTRGIFKIKTGCWQTVLEGGSLQDSKITFNSGLPWMLFLWLHPLSLGSTEASWSCLWGGEEGWVYGLSGVTFVPDTFV